MISSVLVSMIRNGSRAHLHEQSILLPMQVRCRPAGEGAAMLGQPDPPVLIQPTVPGKNRDGVTARHSSVERT